ncbi:ABC transporter permease [Paenibacillus sp. LHD-117]|uniref:ABC transporter permease n=1 Tax=Paenibacillus sp. LHD-117 TaxID=3071412 RepID=UPI0027E02D06|nr:ABC transporter permease [Paenibacillus sp. LHD-117]MDQ6422385.1 ABC transporter permease [Paenibacillus sp. LHD-117]
MKQMLRFIRRKMWNNRTLTASSFIGLLLAVAFTASIPVYTEHALSKMIATSLNDSDAAPPPGSLLLRYQAARNAKTELDELKAVDAYIENKLPQEIGYPRKHSVASYALGQSQLRPSGGQTTDNRRRQMTLMSQTGMKEQVELTDGRMYGASNADGTIEAIVSEEAMARNFLKVGDVYTYTVTTQSGNKTVDIRIVGAFRPKDERSAYWYQGVDSYSGMLMIAPETMKETVLGKLGGNLASANWYSLYELSALNRSDLSRLENKLERLEPNLFRMLRDTRVDLSFLDLIAKFKREDASLQALLVTLAVPMLAMCFYFINMNARQALERQRNDIAVLRSRGARMRLVYGLFLMEGAILGAAAWLSGMLLALGMARLMVWTDGFMQFNPGKEASIGWSALSGWYGLAAVAVAILAGTLPVGAYGKQSIVDYKKQLARSDRAPLWQRWYLDAALLLASGLGWYGFSSGQLLAGGSGDGGGVQAQPLFFLVPALAMFASGLVCLRLFPILLRLLHRLFRRWIPVSLHLVFVQLSRSQRSYYPLMLLLIMTLGLGVFHASAARTMDRNESERLMYGNGADVVLQPVWEGEVELFDEEGNYIPEDQPRNTIYTEPPQAPFEHMPGVASSVRVLQLDGELSLAGKGLGKGKLMGVDNVDFAKSAWWRTDLYKTAHPFTLLRFLGEYEQGAIISSSFAKQHGLKPGDLIQMTAQDIPIELVVVGVTDYWPSLDPNSAFVVANLDYVYEQIPLTPYALWLDMEGNAKVMPIVEHLRSQGIETSAVSDARNEWILRKLQPEREGIYGILSLGFIVSVAVSFIGYLLFWVFSLARRTVQLGILRATGLMRGQLTFMLLLEQLLTTGLAIALGLAIGRLAGRLFIPFLQSGANNQVPPFAIVFEMRDTLQLLIIVLAMIAAGGTLLTAQIMRMRVHQAVKLGEER